MGGGMLNEEPGWEKTLSKFGDPGLSVNLEKPSRGLCVFRSPEINVQKQTNKQKILLLGEMLNVLGEIREETLNLNKPRKNKIK